MRKKMLFLKHLYTAQKLDVVGGYDWILDWTFDVQKSMPGTLIAY